MHPKATGSRNYTQCDSLLIGDKCGAHTVPYIECKNNSSRVEHEATTSKVDEDKLFYCRQRGMDEEEAVALVVNGFCREVLAGAADGVRHGGAEAGGDQPGRERRVMDVQRIQGEAVADVARGAQGVGRGHGDRGAGDDALHADAGGAAQLDVPGCRACCCIVLWLVLTVVGDVLECRLAGADAMAEGE